MSNETISSIECLPCELWMEMFNYLDWINIITAFYGINKRINQLVKSMKILTLHSSYIREYSNTLYVLFQEFALEKFKQIQHFKYIDEVLAEKEFNIAKYLGSFPQLISFDIATDQMDKLLHGDIATSCFFNHFPFLKRLCIHGEVYNQPAETNGSNALFAFPSLRYMIVNKMDFTLALQVLGSCHKLSYFSTSLYGDLEYIDRKRPTILPPSISMSLTSLLTLKLDTDDYMRNDFLNEFLELLLPCCPNLRTFSIVYSYSKLGRKPINPIWWTQVLASNSKLENIYIKLNGYGVLNYLAENEIEMFKSLPLFARLNVTVTYSALRIEFPRMIHYYVIQN